MSKVDDLDGLHPIDDFSRETLRRLIARIERSFSDEQLIYREAELDEVWRLLDGAVAERVRHQGFGGVQESLESLRSTVMEAHDLIGVNRDPVASSARLRDGLLLAPAT